MAEAKMPDPAPPEKPTAKAADTPILDDLAHHVGEVAATMRDMMAYYGYEGDIPEHVLAAFQNGKNLAPLDLERALLQKLHIHMLMLWAQAKVPGPNTTANLLSQARKADRAAQSLTKLGQSKAAQKQTAKAAELRKAAIESQDTVKRWW